jgi:hypothetical protein
VEDRKTIKTSNVLTYVDSRSYLATGGPTSTAMLVGGERPPNWRQQGLRLHSVQKSTRTQHDANQVRVAAPKAPVRCRVRPSYQRVPLISDLPEVRLGQVSAEQADAKPSSPVSLAPRQRQPGRLALRNKKKKTNVRQASPGARTIRQESATRPFAKLPPKKMAIRPILSER